MQTHQQREAALVLAKQKKLDRGRAKALKEVKSLIEAGLITESVLLGKTGTRPSSAVTDYILSVMEKQIIDYAGETLALLRSTENSIRHGVGREEIANKLREHHKKVTTPKFI